MTFVAFCIIFAFAELHVANGVKYAGIDFVVAADNRYNRFGEISEPPLFLQTHRKDPNKAPATTTSQLLLPRAPVLNESPGDKSAGLDRMNALVKDLDSMNDRLASSDDGQLREDSAFSFVDRLDRVSQARQKDPHPIGSVKHTSKFKDQVVPAAPATSFLAAGSSNRQEDSKRGEMSGDIVKIDAEVAKAGASHTRMSASFERPQAQFGQADTVRFGLYGKLFYGTDLKNQEFTIDNVMTLEWTDTRTQSLVPAGQDSLTISETEAKSKLWLPDIWITNKIAQKSDPISSSLTINSTGAVTLVERSYATIKNRFELEDYPFDEQKLRLAIASEKYMLNELILSPIDDPQVSGLRSGFFKDAPYEMAELTIDADDDVDGLMKKSVGYMEITIRRTPSKYQHRYLFPALLYSAISCAVFWLPFTPPFVVPRLALSIIILLVFCNFSIIVDAELPEGAPYNWMDLICIVVRLHMFSVICINVFTEVALYTMGCKVAAIQMNNEMKVLSPLAIGLAFLLICIGTQTQGALNLTALTILLPILFTLYFGTYVTCCAMSLSAELRKARLAEKDPFEDGYGGGPLSSAESLTPVPRYYDS